MLLIHQLYLNLVAKLDTLLQQLQGKSPDVGLVIESVRATFAIQYQYKFILTDFVAIMRNIPAIHTHFRTLFIRRKQEFSALIAYLVQVGYFREEQYPGQFNQLIVQFYLIGDFWIAEAEILFDGSDEEKLNHYSRVAYGLVFPYLTEKGRAAWMPLFTQS